MTQTKHPRLRNKESWISKAKREKSFTEYLQGIFEINNGVKNDPATLAALHGPTLFELAQKESTESPNIEDSLQQEQQENEYKPIDEIQEQREALLDNIQEIMESAQALVEAVEQYVEPKPGTSYMHRTKILAIKNRVKELLK